MAAVVGKNIAGQLHNGRYIVQRRGAPGECQQSADNMSNALTKEQGEAGVSTRADRHHFSPGRRDTHGEGYDSPDCRCEATAGGVR
jgi:hypothetical protein